MMTKKKIETMDSLFDKDGNLWVEITDDKLPPTSLIEQPGLFIIEHDAPGRMMINLTKYINMLMTERFRNRS